MDSAPENYPQVPGQILCMYCGCRGNAVYRRDDFYFTFFFIPLCRLKKGNPYLSCDVCRSRFSNFGTNVCKKCRTAVPGTFHYCPHCGAKEEMDIQPTNSDSILMECRIWGMGYKIWYMKYEVWNMGYKIWYMEIWGMEYKIWYMEYEVWGMGIQDIRYRI
ncbi:putative zinc-ribbon domain-containing protein [Hamiltosporidium tvaerminnensis]|uniref:Putative zinc-ribbon domain-containing protein n=1 Tax=Hamiltosporidium tvaerminnensis TaxID=1176355 RepID=A0A4Q9LQF2_9MICR|nr:putative zinc-ribbon domain-containing protein [Hamiltosporidium tvaerminnensis]